MKNDIISRINAVRWQTWALAGIVAIGAFLRTYHFQQLIIFASDQSRDYFLVKNVIENHAAWPLLGPDMTGGEGFRLGPVYYYMQIIAAKIFGLSYSHQAYPDVFFGILSIPLLFLFLKRFFDESNSLLLTSLYTFSYFIVEYSRFAWNVNLIPFFTILFLISIYEFLIARELTHWKWVVGVGISLGVGFQLHAILLLLFPALFFFVFVYLMKENWLVWKKCLAIILLALALNVPQLISEQKTGFANTKTFLNAFVFKSERTGTTVRKGILLDVACNTQANMHIVSSLGNKNICDFLYGNEVSTTYKTGIKLDMNRWSLAGKFVSLVFFVIGLMLLGYNFHKQLGNKKVFLGLLILYAALYYAIMIPVAPGSRMRYYLPIVVMPFVFLGLINDFLQKKYGKKYLWMIFVIFLFLFSTNIYSMRQHLNSASCDKYIQKNFGCNLNIPIN